MTTKSQVQTRFTSFSEFYPYYLKEHANPRCKQLHFIGSWLVLIVIACSFIFENFMLLWIVPIVGYGFAWVGHFFYEKNRPATFRYPIYSLMGDWVMFKDILTGKVTLNK